MSSVYDLSPDPLDVLIQYRQNSHEESFDQMYPWQHFTNITTVHVEHKSHIFLLSAVIDQYLLVCNHRLQNK